jgi:hypothetical protein
VPFSTLRLSFVSILLGVLPRLMPAADIEFATQELPWAIVDRPYSVPPLSARSSGACPLGGVSFAVVSGSLPPGLELSRLGYFSGVPMQTGMFEFAVRVSNGCTWTARHFVLTVTGAPILTVEPQKVSFRWVDGSAALEAQVIRVSSTWPRLVFSISSNASWLSAVPEHGYTPRASSSMAEDFVSVSADGSALKAGTYTAQLVFSSWEVLQAPVVTVELVVVRKQVTERSSPNESPTSASRP